MKMKEGSNHKEEGLDCDYDEYMMLYFFNF